MEKHDINSPALRDPKREWYDAEEVEAVVEALDMHRQALIEKVGDLEEEIEALKKAQEWRDDWENAVGKKDVLILEHEDIRLYKGTLPQGWCNSKKEWGAKFKLL